MFSAACLLLAFLAAPAQDLTGDWKLEQVVENGRPVKDPDPFVWNFTADGKLKVTLGDKTKETTYKSDATKTPPTIDLAFGGPEKKGIYEISGDTLRICSSELQREERRPTSFDKNEFTTTLFVFKRAAKPKE